MHKPAQKSARTKPTGYTKDELIDCAAKGAYGTLIPAKLALTSPHTISAFLERIRNTDDQRFFLRKFDAAAASDVLSEMEPDVAAEVLSAMRESRAVNILEALDPDDAADLVRALESSHRERLLHKVDPATAATVRKLIRFHPQTAGGIMTPEVAMVNKEMTAAQAIEAVRALHQQLETIDYFYVVDDAAHLEGVVSMRDLVFSQPDQQLATSMTSDLKGVCHLNTDQEAVALKMTEHNFRALPVVDDNNRLVGIVTHDDVLDVMQEEATEDLQKMVGAGADETVYDDLLASVRGRSPWLLMNLITAFLAGGVVMLFQERIAELTLLAACLPIIASLGGNTGAQTLAIIIRSLALGEITAKDSRWICIKEGTKGLLSGILIGLAAGAIAGLFANNLRTAEVVFFAMLLTMTFASIAGAFIPLLLQKLHLDPAQSSSIFLTASTDIVGFAIFLGLSNWMLF